MEPGQVAKRGWMAQPRRLVFIEPVVLKAYCELTKPRVVGLLVFTALVGMLMASPAHLADLAWWKIGWAVWGIGLAASAAACINHVVDRAIDARMKRTSHRPLPNHVISVPGALVFAGLLTVVSCAVLAYCVNGLTAALTMAGVVGYAGIYTGFLKRRTPQNIVLGGAAGAIPPVLGWAAVTGHTSLDAWILFLIVFLWTPAHFWPLAIHRRDDYREVGVPMLPVTHGVPHTARQILLYTIATVAVTQLPYFTGMSGMLYLAGAEILNAGFLYQALRLVYAPERHHPMKAFGYSIIYLTLLFALLLADHYLRGGLGL